MARQVMERYLTPSEETKLLTHIKGFRDLKARRDHAWMMLARYTGIRVIALSGLDLCDAWKALENKRLYVRSEINKGDKAYDIALHRKAAKALKELLIVNKKMGGDQSNVSPLILSRNHKRMSIRSFQNRMTNWVKDAGLTVAASPHWWRHTFAMRFKAESIAQDWQMRLMRLLGHSDINSTVIYTWPTREEVDRELLQMK